MSLSLRFAAGSHKGMIREGNEDSGYAGPRLLAVADGMGGQAAGEVASSEVLSTLVVLDEDLPGADLREALRMAIERANERLHNMIEDDPQLEGMGTTLTALLWTGSGGMGLAHIGDSRAYLLRDGVLDQITQDHTWVQRLVDEGRITEEEADHHPQRSLLMRALDGRGQVEPDLSVREARLHDRYLICSDGLSGVVSRETMEATLLNYEDPRDAIQELIQLALRGGGPDNITCVVADVVDAGEHPSDIPLVVGAVADDRHDTATLPTTPASRARELTNGHHDDSAATLTDSPPSRRRPKPAWRRTLPIWGTLAVVAVAGLGGAYWWTQSQYYVAADGNHVAIYRGVDTSILGLKLSKPYQQFDDTTLDLVGQEHRDALSRTIGADNLGEARETARKMQLQAQVCRKIIDWNNEPAPAPAPQVPAPGPSSSAAPAPTGTEQTKATAGPARTREGTVSRSTPRPTATRSAGTASPSGTAAPTGATLPAETTPETPAPVRTGPVLTDEEAALQGGCDVQPVAKTG